MSQRKICFAHMIPTRLRELFLVAPSNIALRPILAEIMSKNRRYNLADAILGGGLEGSSPPYRLELKLKIRLFVTF